MIEKNWMELQKPDQISVKASEYNPRQAVISVGPLERGFGITLGNSLRRILLSSLQGAAVTAVQIQGVVHEFSSIAGVREDVTDLILNIKGIAVSLEAEGSKRVRLHAEGPLEVTASMISETAGVEIMNPDHIICHLDKEATLVMELTIESGKGYVPAAQNRSEDSPIGLIPVDAIFSPIRQVAYKVENERVGQITVKRKAICLILNDF